MRTWGGEIVHSSSRGARGSGAIRKIFHFSLNERASLVAQMVKNLPATQVLGSAVQQSESAICIPISPVSLDFLPV